MPARDRLRRREHDAPADRQRRQCSQQQPHARVTPRLALWSPLRNTLKHRTVILLRRPSSGGRLRVSGTRSVAVLPTGPCNRTHDRSLVSSPETVKETTHAVHLHPPFRGGRHAPWHTRSCLPAQAGFRHPRAIPAERVEQTTAATAHFTCELRPFDLSKGLFCYGPAAIRSAYNLAGMIDSGLNGAGQTIVILDAFGSPTVKADLDTFDALFGLPAPPSFTVVRMPGLPPFDLNNGNMLGWAEETSLDVQWAHAIAPGANIVLVEAASNSDDDLVAGLNYALDHRLGNVVSMSFGESEASLTDADGQRVVAAWEAAFKKARQQRVTLFVSSGDQAARTSRTTPGTSSTSRTSAIPPPRPRSPAWAAPTSSSGPGGRRPERSLRPRGGVERRLRRRRRRREPESSASPTSSGRACRSPCRRCWAGNAASPTYPTTPAWWAASSCGSGSLADSSSSAGPAPGRRGAGRHHRGPEPGRGRTAGLHQQAPLPGGQVRGERRPLPRRDGWRQQLGRRRHPGAGLPGLAGIRPLDRVWNAELRRRGDDFSDPGDEGHPNG